MVSGQDHAIMSFTHWDIDGNGGTLDSKMWVEVREIPLFAPGNTYEFRKFGKTPPGDPMPLEFQGTLVPGTAPLTQPQEQVQVIPTVSMLGAPKTTITPTEQRDSSSQIPGLLLSATNPSEGTWFESIDPLKGEGRVTVPLAIAPDLPVPAGVILPREVEFLVT